MKAVFSDIDAQTKLIIRVCASICVLIMMFYNIFPTSKQQVLNPGECMRDQTFIWTDKYNKYLQNNLELKRKMVIGTSFMMDCTQAIGISIYFLRTKSIRGPLAFGVFFPLR